MASKISSDMLAITPSDSNPKRVVNDVIKMFSADARKKKINLTARLVDSLEEMKVDQLVFDSNRLSQVLVNLVGNAIKFTSGSPERQISVLVGISTSKPSNGDHGVVYLERSQSEAGTNNDVAQKPNGRETFLRIVVQDTGVGMSNEVKQRLFQRFGQGKTNGLQCFRYADY